MVFERTRCLLAPLADSKCRAAGSGARCLLAPPVGAIWHFPPGPSLLMLRSMQYLIARNRAAKRLARLLIALAASIVSVHALAGELTIDVSGINPDRGKIHVAVYDSAETFPISGRQLVGQILDPAGRQFTVHFKDLPPGAYAAVAFQDFNGNGKLDKNFLGIPKEPYGFSNGARGAAGPPKFSYAAITLSPDGATKIELK